MEDVKKHCALCFLVAFPGVEFKAILILCQPHTSLRTRRDCTLVNTTPRNPYTGSYHATFKLVWIRRKFYKKN